MSQPSVAVVTVIVPTRNEAADIEGCLEAIAAQDHPVNHLEVIVIDGCSTDGTGELARRALGRWGFMSTAVFSNEGATASSNLNVGLSKATGEIVCRVDARTRIQPDYVRTCVAVLRSRPEVAVVGGAQRAVPRDPRATSVGIARALNNRWSMGGSRYRRSKISGESDTVYLGAFRRSDLVDEGGWDERLMSNQDFDLNRRMSRRGLVWFEGALSSGYLPRASYRELWSQYARFGRAKVTYWQLSGARPEARQWALMSAPAISVAAAALFLAAKRPPRVALLGLGLGSALLLEVNGADDPRGTPAAHLAGVWGMLVVAGAWSGGLWRQILRGRPGQGS